MLSCTQEDHESGRYMQNRELSWLQFNERCMRQAKDSSNPLLERLRFLSRRRRCFLSRTLRKLRGNLPEKNPCSIGFVNRIVCCPIRTKA